MLLRYEIDWREEEIKYLENIVKQDTQNKEYYLNKIQTLTFALEWCKWFLNEK